MTYRLIFAVGQCLQGVGIGALLAVAIWKLFAASGTIPVFRYMMF